MENTTQHQSLSSQAYIPSSLEKKRVVLSYFLLWIFVYMTWRELTPYESYHVRRSTWWRMLFLLSFFVFIIPILLVPLFWVIALLCYVPLIGIWLYNCHSSWQGKYKEEGDASVLALIYWLWGWFFTIFEIDVKEKTLQSTDKQDWQSWSDTQN